MRALFHQFNTGENHIMFDFGFNLMSTVFPIIFLLFFAVFIAFAVSILVKGFTQYKRNNASPDLTVNCTVVTKRTEVSHHHHHHDSHMHVSTSTTYYATFQVESGSRMEFAVSGQEYGLLVEGDRGNLTFQGTRYLGFQQM